MNTTAVESASDARSNLYGRYRDRIEVNHDLDRSLVSFQANKAEPFYGWFKYKEGFSSAFVTYVIGKLGRKAGVLLDPFAGAGAALFAARDLGWSAVGIELLPVGFKAIEARSCAERADVTKFAEEVQKAEGTRFSEHAAPEFAFRHITITSGAFPPNAERELSGYLAYCDEEIGDPRVRELFVFACFCVLEEVSYTRKDGQYLRWDQRSPRERLKGGFEKGRIPAFRQAILRKLRRMLSDLEQGFIFPKGSRPALDIRKGSCLDLLPRMTGESFDAVITSPPYCNRYDYTRTYALELAFLGYGNNEVKSLRQEMLSCTVENKEKSAQMACAYERIGAMQRFEQVQRTFGDARALQEVSGALDACRASGGLNNSNVPRMVRNYFYEMCFVVCELARVLRPGGSIVMVNDNVRYAGEEVPVDLILSDFAESFGLAAKHIWTLPRGKGNSSQQMGSHGRQELRKCVYVWEKPARSKRAK